jgi:protein-S-isoprenylcysteine O-methyltransferase Ste14
VVFVLVSVALVYVSRSSLRRPRAHGLWRFWAWEVILVLILLVAPVWFRDPLIWPQIISWLLLLGSPLPLLLGLRSLHQASRSSAARHDPTLLGMEQTTELVTTGIYRYIRHPLYSSLLCLTWGAFWKAPGWSTGALAAAATALLVLTAKTEERENIDFFGTAYRAYMARTRMFIPFLF